MTTIRGATTPSNKELKLTSAERIGRSQLIPGVGPTMAGPRPTTVAGRKYQMIADLNWRAIGLLTAEAYANGRLTELE